MISSQGQDQNAQSDQGNDIRIALEKLYGAMAAEPLIDAKHQVDRVSDERPAVGRPLFRTVAFGVIASVLVGAAFAWQFYGDDQSKHMVGAGKRYGIVASTKSSGSNVVPVELAPKTSDRVPTQDTALLQAAPAIPSAQVSVALGSSPELQDQLETVVSDVAVVRRIVERLAAVQEQMALDIRDGLQKSDQNVRRKVSLPPHSPAAVRPRKYAPSIARSDVVAHSPSVPVRSAPAQPPLAPPPGAAPTGPHPRAPPYVNYCECRSVGLSCRDISLFSRWLGGANGQPRDALSGRCPRDAPGRHAQGRPVAG
jgi:hypothetical protein